MNIIHLSYCDPVYGEIAEWEVFMNQDSAPDLIFGHVSVYTHPTKPTKRMMRKWKKEFRKEIKEERRRSIHDEAYREEVREECARHQKEREYKDIIIDVLGTDL